MPRFMLDKRTMQMVPEKRRVPSKSEMLARVKQVYRKTIQDYAILDRHLELVIEKIERGTRNVDYLSFPDLKTDMRIREVFYFLLREMS